MDLWQRLHLNFGIRGWGLGYCVWGVGRQRRQVMDLRERLHLGVGDAEGV